MSHDAPVRFQLATADTWSTPWPMYRALRDHDPVHHVVPPKHPEDDYYVLSRHADVWAAARDHETFSSARGLTVNYGDLEMIGLKDNPPFVMQDPPVHTEFRKLVSRGFTPRQVEAVEPKVPIKPQRKTIVGAALALGLFLGVVAALVRSKYPALTAQQVLRRITATAHNGARAPSNVVGAGIVDPVAALTWELPASPATEAAPTKPIAAPPAPPRKDNTPRTVAFAGTAVLALVVAAVAAATTITARRRKEHTS